MKGISIIQWGAVLFLCMFSISFAGPYGGGDGTIENPYQIWNIEHFNALSATPEDYNKSFILMDDLDFSSIVYTQTPIAPDTDPNVWSLQGPGFYGIFDGNFHTIRNLTVDNAVIDNIALFGNVKASSILKNITLENVSMTGAHGIGGLVASIEGIITNCHVSGTIRGTYPVGGLIGFNDGGTIKECSSTCTIVPMLSQRMTHSSAIGGLIGYTQYGMVQDCWSKLTVKSEISAREVGGFIGSNNAGTIEHCWAEPDFNLQNGQEVGGFCGSNMGSIRNCITANGTIKSQNNKIGGLVGRNSSLIAQCIAEGTVSGQDNCGGLVGLNEGYIIDSYSSVTTDAEVLSGGFLGTNYYGILRCYSLGAAHCRSFQPGGFAGENYGFIDLSFWNIDTSGLTTSQGGLGLHSWELMQRSTYQCWGSGIWVVEDKIGYPKLIWENTPGIVIEDEPVVYGGGTGTMDDPYLIYTPEQLSRIGVYPQDLTKSYRLMNDLDMQDIEFNGIGFGFGFEGTFDGNGYSIRNLKLRGTLPHTGLFSVILKRGIVKNLNVVDYYLKGRNYVGGLAGKNEGTIVNCRTKGMLAILDEKEARSIYGGLAGYNFGTVTGCRAEVKLISLNTAVRYLGGLIGSNHGIVTESCASGTINITGQDSKWLGGLMGLNSYDSKVYDCYTTVDMIISGKDCEGVGGFTGVQSYRTRIERSYAAGKININPELEKPIVAGFIGRNGHSMEGNAKLIDCFWDMETSGFQTGIALNYTQQEPVGLTSMQMREITPYLEASWSIDSDLATSTVWTYIPGMLPELSRFLILEEENLESYN